MNVVAFALELMEEQGPITTFSQLEELVGELLGIFNTWEKFKRSGGLKSCPNLASSSIVELLPAPGVPVMEDISPTFNPDEQPDFSVMELANLFQEELGCRGADPLEVVGLQQPVQDSQEDHYREYMKGA